MKAYKLTNQNMQTYDGFQWKLGKWYEITDCDEDCDLCTPYWFHFYYSHLLAILLNPIHADISNPRLFVAEVDGFQKDDSGLKGGCTKMKLIEEISLPKITTEQKVKFAIYCALEVYKGKDFVRWANNWLDNTNRAATDADWAARAADADRAAAWAARAARAATWTAWAAWAATWAATAAEAATAATWAARVADIDLITLAERAME
jgi:hypothetical protein